MTESECLGCGLVLPATGGPIHAYVATSPECWALFGRTAPAVGHRLLSDGYMAQHPDGDGRRQLQSVAVHLITLSAILDHGRPISAASKITAAAVAIGKSGSGYAKLRRPAAWHSTINDVAGRTISADRFIEDVLWAWETTEGERIEGWTRATLESLYVD